MVKLVGFPLSDQTGSCRYVNKLLSCMLVMTICIIPTPASANNYAPNLGSKSINHQPQEIQDKIRILPQNKPNTTLSNLLSPSETHDSKNNQSSRVDKRKAGVLSSVNATLDKSFNTTREVDDLSTSDTRLEPQTFNGYPDEEPDQQNEEGPWEETDNYNEAASSQVSEQKVIKELRKIISRGMSGATDKVRLETLENWKAKQEERKAAKDSRSKLFEEILTAAINTHPERVKKGANKGNKASGSESSSKHMNSLAEVGDYETVFNQLSSLVSTMDKHPIESIEPSDEFTIEGGSEAGPVEDNNSDSSQEGKGRKKEADSKERPMIKKIKKIKKQFYQRRKQLDQIKNMFNIDLSLNPKDGSLMGKQLKKKLVGLTSNEDESQDDDTETSSTQKRKTKGADKGNKIEELMGYLKENPEILASIMDELTAGSSIKKQYPAVDDNTPFLPDSTSDDPSPSYSHGYQNKFDASNLRKRQELTGSWPRSRRSNKDYAEKNVENISRHPRFRSQLEKLHDDGHKPFSNPPLPRLPSSEALLLSSLRERQLMNLARLDMVLASRQSGSNKSFIFSTPNASNASSISRSQNSTERGSPTINQPRTPRNSHQQSYGANQHNNSDEVHHYMVMNPDQRELFSLGKHIDADNYSQIDLNRQSQSTMDSNGRYSPRLRNQSSDSLSRFNEWRDVSQSEANSLQRADRVNNNPVNAIWVPYDLATGGSSASSDAHKSASSPQNYRTSLRYLNTPPTFNESQPTFHDAQINQQSRGDSTIIRPGSQLPFDYRPEDQNIRVPKKTSNLTFVARDNPGSYEIPTAPSIDLPGSRIDHQAMKAPNAELEDADVSLEDVTNEDDPLISDQNKVQTAGPIDYFSAYKPAASGEFHQDKNMKSAVFGFKKRQNKIPDSRGGDPGMGAIWAR